MSVQFVEAGNVDIAATLMLNAERVPQCPTDLGRALWLMNADAMARRYSSLAQDEIVAMRREASAYTYIGGYDLPAPAMVKIAECLSYQCETDWVRTLDDPLSARLEAAVDGLAGALGGWDRVRTLDDYRSAPWLFERPASAPGAKPARRAAIAAASAPSTFQAVERSPDDVIIDRPAAPVVKPIKIAF